MEVRYAQEYGGQKLHLVESYPGGLVSLRAICGRKPTRRGTWRMTINVPLGNACKRCLRGIADRPPLPVTIHI